MLISDLMVVLESVKSVHGDIPVCIHNNQYGVVFEINRSFVVGRDTEASFFDRTSREDVNNFLYLYCVKD